MDPNETLRRLRKLVTETIEVEQSGVQSDNASDLADLFEALDTWIVNGGFLPDSWQPKQKR